MPLDTSSNNYILEQIVRCETALVKAKEQRDRLEIIKSKAKIGLFKSDSKEAIVLFDKIRASDVKISQIENHLTLQLNSLKIFLIVSSAKEKPIFNRIVIGAGTAATLVFAEMPPEFRKTNSDNPNFPGVLVLNDNANSNTWLKENKRLMGQPDAVQTPPILSAHSSDYNLEMGHDFHNPYQYVVANNFLDALIETQNDLGMQVLNLKATSVESQDKVSPEEKNKNPWIHPKAKHRVLVQINEDKVEYLYTHAIDLCHGLGDARRLTYKQIEPNLQKTLIKNKQLVYACDGDSELKGNVVFFGGSAVNASWIAEIILLNAQPKASVMCLVATKHKPLDETPNLNRLISDVCKTDKLKMCLGNISNVKQLSDGRLEIKFGAPETVSTNYPNLAGTKMICDCLVVGIGQEYNPLNEKFSGFELCMDDSNQIPLGTHSVDKTIVSWGAAGSIGIGLDSTMRKVATDLITKHADSTLVENNALGGISRSSWTVAELAKKLKQTNSFPQANNYQPHSYDIPRINQATRHELAVFFAEVDSTLSNDKCLEYADAVITERLKIFAGSLEPTGIHSIDRLEKILPLSLLVATMHKYFPFKEIPTSLSSVIKRKSSIPEQAANTPSIKMTPKLLSWLAEQRQTSDANIFISSATSNTPVNVDRQKTGHSKVALKVT